MKRKNWVFDDEKRCEVIGNIIGKVNPDEVEE